MTVNCILVIPVIERERGFHAKADYHLIHDYEADALPPVGAAIVVAEGKNAWDVSPEAPGSLVLAVVRTIWSMKGTPILTLETLAWCSYAEELESEMSVRLVEGGWNRWATSP